MKGRSKKGKNKSDKITPGEFFSIEIKVLRELWKEYRGETTAIIILVMLSAGSQLVEPKFLEYITNTVSVWLSGRGAFGDVIAVSVSFLWILLLFQCLSCISNSITVKYKSKTAAMAEKKITDKLARIPYECYESSDFYDKINMARQASGGYWGAVDGITHMAVIVLMLVVYAVMLYRINVAAVAAIYLLLTISVVAATKVSDIQTSFYREQVSPVVRCNDYFRLLLGNRVSQQNIQTSGTLPYFGGKYACYNEQELKNCMKLNTLSFSTELGSSVLFLIIYFVVLYSVGKGVKEGTYKIGYFTMTAALLWNLFSVMKDFIYDILNQSWFVRILGAYYEMLDMAEKKAPEWTCGRSFLAVNGIRYRYPQSERYVLQGVSAKFKRGERVAVVGGNGSGKTTLISIILGLFSAYEGNIRGDGAVCTAVLQDFGQYQMTVKENIEIGCGGRELPEEEVLHILKMVDLYDFVMEKPNGIYTKLGQLEEGTELSKGQWQRLAAGRLLANRDANVWILDEPTAYLDPIAEIEMYDRIFELAEDRLVFFISHRLGFARKANRILVIHEGKIAENGTHDELCDRGGIYAQMYAVQKEWYG